MAKKTDGELQPVAEKKVKRGRKSEEKIIKLRKLPKMYRKTYTEKQFNKKILSKIYIESDKNEITRLFAVSQDEKQGTLYSVPSDIMFSKTDYLFYKNLAKEIGANSGTVRIVPLLAVVCFIAAIGIAGTLFKDIIAKKAIKSVCESVFSAKTDIGSVHVEIFGTDLSVNYIAIGNRNDEYKNLFEAEKIQVAFSLTKALCGKFDAENLEASGMKFGTDRKDSCILPAKEKKIKKESEKNNAFVSSLKDKSDKALEDLKNQLMTMLGGASVEEITANIQSQLKTPAAVEEAKTVTNEMISKWQSKPKELERQVKDFSSSVQSLQKINVSGIKNPQELKSTLEKIQNAIDSGKYLEKSVSSIQSEIKSDSSKVTAQSQNVQKAVLADKKFAQEQLGQVSDTLKNSKKIFESALDTVGYDMMGKYYPYVQKGIDYASKIKAESASSAKSSDNKKKELKRKENSRRLTGRTLWFSTESPAFLIERSYVSGPGFSAEAKSISSNQNLSGCPMTLNANFDLKGINHDAALVVDARSDSKDDLIQVQYKGKGFDINYDGTKIASSSGIPSVSGKADVTLKGSADENGFSFDGKIMMNPCTLTSDGFANATVTKYYQTALSGVKNLSLGYNASFYNDKGVQLDLDGNFADQFASALSKVLSEIGTDAKDAALAKINSQLGDYSSLITGLTGNFDSIKGGVDSQINNLNQIQAQLEAKKKEIQKQLSDAATNTAKSAAGSLLNSLKK